ncbi:MAG: hypothetical protein AAB368_01375 [bacterium]
MSGHGQSVTRRYCALQQKLTGGPEDETLLKAHGFKVKDGALRA